MLATSHSAASVLLAFALAGLLHPVQASVFLGKLVPSRDAASEEDLKFENSLLSQIEEVLGSEHRVFTEKRLDSIKHSLLPIFAALPKNKNGKLGQAAVSYALYRLFVQRHAWFVVGLEPFKALSEWNSTSAVSVIDQRVPAYVSGLFHTRMFEHGFGSHELAVLAATIEHLVHKESLLRLAGAYKAQDFQTEDILSPADGEEVMDTYMAMYILGPLIRNISNVSTAWVRFLRANVSELYPGFEETQKFVRDVSESIAPSRDYLYYSDIANLVEEVGDRYGRWQDHECRSLKDMLVEKEDKSVGGAGRVRLADFYHGALHQNQWQLCESVTYLRKLGALDETDPDNLRVIIPNYVNGPSNCVASSSYYSVCCINECEEILSHLEVKIAAPEATPSEIAQIIAQLPSATLTGNRTLSPWLLRRLDEVSQHHGGLVPFHGRLFAQWLHYAYPRECPYPHVVGATQPQTADQYVRETRQDFAATKEAMKAIIDLPLPNQTNLTEDTDDIEELMKCQSGMWTMDEELVVWRPPEGYSPKASLTSWQAGLRVFACVSAVVSAALSLYRLLDRKSPSGQQGSEKYYV